jgi:hypothetical protein
VLDVILDRAVPGFGSRSFGDDPEEVAKMGRAFMRGLRDGGVASLAKHFPLGGSLKFDESSTTVPIIHETLEQLRHKVLVPFREAIEERIPSIMACGVAISSLGPRLLHACFSRKIVTELLREQLGFEGVVVSECLEMTSIAPNVGVGQASIMGIRACWLRYPHYLPIASPAGGGIRVPVSYSGKQRSLLGLNSKGRPAGDEATCGTHLLVSSLGSGGPTTAGA